MNEVQVYIVLVSFSLIEASASEVDSSGFHARSEYYNYTCRCTISVLVCISFHVRHHGASCATSSRLDETSISYCVNGIQFDWQPSMSTLSLTTLEILSRSLMLGQEI